MQGPGLDVARALLAELKAQYDALGDVPRMAIRASLRSQQRQVVHAIGEQPVRLSNFAEAVGQ